MSTPISTKFAALAVALLVNGLMFSSVAYLFNGQLHDLSMASALHTRVSASSLAKI